MLSELAIDNKEAFSDLVVIAKDAINGKSYVPKKIVKEVKKEETKEEKPVKKTTAKKTVKKETK